MAPNHGSEATLQPSAIKLLSLDGGGIRGLSSLIILKYLMKRVNPSKPPKPCEYFDLIGGTSTGGIIALLLGRLEMDIDTCIKVYIKLSSEVFKLNRMKANFIGRVKDKYNVKGKYSDDKLAQEMKDIIKSVEGDPQAKLAAPNKSCRIFVCSFMKTLNTPILLRSYTHDSVVENLSTSNCAIWEAARATSAAVTFFDSITIGRQTFVDGGTGYNNPVEVVLREAKSIWPNALFRIQSLVSIGTGVPDLKDFGDNIEEVIDTLVKISTETEETAKSFFDLHKDIGLDGRYFRFSVQHGLGNVQLDEHDKVGVIEAATERYLDLQEVKNQISLFVGCQPQGARRDAKNTLLGWLKFSDSFVFRNAARDKHTKSTGDWFLKKDFETWKSTASSFLWLYGKAGCGKTILSSTIIQQIENQRLGVLAYFYFSFRRTEPQGLRNLMHSVLAQTIQRLVRNDERQPNHYHVPKAFQDLYDGTLTGSEPDIEDLYTTFVGVLTECENFYLVIDALDECPNSRDRADILKFLVKISGIKTTKTHVLVTSRQEEDIHMTIERLSISAKILSIPIQNPEVAHDIRIHVERCIYEDPEYHWWTPELKEKVITDLIAGADGVFRWVECQLVALWPMRRPDDVLEVLRKLPRDLDETYARIIARIKQSGYAKEALTALKWLAFSRRPLGLNEIGDAAIFDILKESEPIPCELPVSFNPKKRFGNPSDIRSILSQLVTLTGQDETFASLHRINQREAHARLTFAHYSVKEYLLCDRVESDFRIDAGLAHRFILESCVIYILNFVKSVGFVEEYSAQEYPLLEYCCQNWAHHAKEVASAQLFTSRTDHYFCALFEDNGIPFLTSLKFGFSKATAKFPLFISNTAYASPAWFFSYLNLERGLIYFRRDANIIESGLELRFDGVTALHTAARLGHTKMITALLDSGADIESKDRDNGTPLHSAAAAGQIAATEMLLEKGAEGIARDKDNETPLHRAVRSGDISTVLILSKWKNGGSLELKEVYGLTPYHLAVRISSWQGATGKDVCQSLLHLGSNPETVNFAGETAKKEAEGNSDIQLASLANYDYLMSVLNFFDDELFSEELNDCRSSTPAWSIIELAQKKAIWSRDSGLGMLLYLATKNAVYGSCGSFNLIERRDSSAPGRARHFATTHRSVLEGEELFRHFVKFFKDLFYELKMSSTQRSRSSVLDFYSREWQRFTKGARTLARAASYLEDHWIKRVLDEGSKYFRIFGLCMHYWKDDYLDSERRIIPCILQQVERQRNGDVINTDTLKSILESLVIMDDETHYPGHEPKKFDFYESYFEKHFLKASEEHCQSKKAKMIRDGRGVVATQKIEDFISHDKALIGSYVLPSTLVKIDELYRLGAWRHQETFTHKTSAKRSENKVEPVN